MDIKSFLIGFLVFLCMMLLTGFGGSSSVGRYQYHHRDGSMVVIDTTTGMIKVGNTYYEFKIPDKSKIR
jgi:hypothetical protein